MTEVSSVTDKPTSDMDPKEIIAPELNEKSLKLTDDLTNGMLRDYIVELEQQKTKLLLSLKEYRQKYEQQKIDQSDIYFYLNKKLDENYETIAALEEQILSEQADRESQERALEKRIHTLELESVATEAKYLAKLNEAEEKLSKLKEFGENKDELDRNLKRLLDTLEVERRQFRTATEEMERRAVQERDRIKKDCARQFEEYKETLQADADQKLSLKTKRTQAINSMIKSELSYQSKQADHVLLYNQKVLERDRDLRQQLELSQTTQEEMVNRLALYQRLIKQLNERVIAEETQSADTIRNLQHLTEAKEFEIKQLTTQLTEARSKLQNERSNQQNVWNFLAHKYKKIIPKSSSAKDLSLDQIADPDDKILSHLIFEVLQKFPEKNPYNQTKARPRTLEDGSMTLPRIPRRTNPQNDIDVVSSTTTGIYTWDTARSSPRQKWWSSTVGEEAAVENCSQRSVSVQTEGYLLPYPPNSSWLKKSPENEVIADKYQESQSIKQEDLNYLDKLSVVDDSLMKINQGQPKEPSVLAGDPLAKKRPTHRSHKSQLGTSLVGKGRIGKKVYVEANSFLRDEDFSSQDSSPHQDYISVNGRSINNRPTKSRIQPRKMEQRMNQDVQEEGNNYDSGMDDNTIISNITLSPR